MDALFSFCSSIKKQSDINLDEVTSEMQLNVFEFRNYRSVLGDQQQHLLERIVNQWCVMLVRGKTMHVNNFETQVFLDKDLLRLEYDDEYYPLKVIREMNMFRDPDQSAQYGLEVTFEAQRGDQQILFNFSEERQRLNFALTLRILRTRDPQLDPSSTMKVTRDDKDDSAEKSFKELVDAQHFHAEAGTPIIFSVSDMKLYEKLQSTSRHVYLEFFVRYPHQDRFLYAKSPTTHIPSSAVQTDDLGMRRRGNKKNDDEDEEEVNRQKEQRNKAFGGQMVPIAAMRFDLKNVKLKVPKVPHMLFGRLMAKDDYFPTAVGTFKFDIKKEHLQDRRPNAMKQPVVGSHGKAPRRTSNDGSRAEPETMSIDVMSAWKMMVKTKDKSTNEEIEEEQFAKIGLLTIRIIGYVVEDQKDKKKKHGRVGAKAGDDSDDEDEDDEDEDEDEEQEQDEDEEQDEEDDENQDEEEEEEGSED